MMMRVTHRKVTTINNIVTNLTVKGLLDSSCLFLSLKYVIIMNDDIMIINGAMIINY